MYASLWQERRAARNSQPGGPLLAWAGTAALPPLERVGDIVHSSLEMPPVLRRQSGLPAWTQTLPLAWAEVQGMRLGNPHRPWVVLMEDLHNQEEAQRNIARVLESFGTASGRTPFPVAIEGGSGSYDFSSFRRAGPPDAVRRVADHFLKKGWISGAQFAGLTAEHSPVFVGAEDPSLYQANIDAFQSSRPLLPKTESALAESGRWLANQKGKVFSEKVRTLDDARTRFHAGTLNVKDYLSTLAGLSPFQPTNNLARFLDLTHREASLNFAAVERERTDLLGKLSLRLDRRSMETLSALAVAYRAGEISYGTIYGRIETLAQHHGVTFGSSFRDYLDYLGKADAIDRRAFLEELSTYEAKTAQSLLKTEEERVLWRQGLEWSLADKLVHQNLSASEWAEYKVIERRPINGATPNPKDVRFAGMLDPKQLEPFETFYRVAIQRNEALADGLKQAVANKRPREEVPAGVLVAGGFHSAGLTDALDARGFNVLTLAPKIKTLNGEHYMAAFTRDRSPLDQILAGEKLFLATPQTLGQDLATVPTAHREEAAARSDYFKKLASALADWAKGRAEIQLANGKRLLILMGEKAQGRADLMEGYVVVDQGPQLVVMAKRATAWAAGIGLALSVITAHQAVWNKQVDVIHRAGDRVFQTAHSVRRGNIKGKSQNDLPALLEENMKLRADLMKAVDLRNKEEAYRLYDSLAETAGNLSSAIRSATEEQFERNWLSLSPQRRREIPSDQIKDIRLELIEQGLTDFPEEQKALLDDLKDQLVHGMFAGDPRENDVRAHLTKSLTPGHFSVVCSKKILDVFFEVAEEYGATRDPQASEALSRIAGQMEESLNPLGTFHRLGSVVSADGGRLVLKTYLTPRQTGHVFMHEAIHLGGFQGWLKIPWTAEHFPHANQILYLVKENGVGDLETPDLLSEMSLPVRALFERGRRIGERGELGFLILPGASGENFNYFSNAPLLNEATGVLSMSGDDLDKLLDPYMAQRATGIVLAGVLAGRAARDPNFQPLATMRGLYESLHERLGPPTEDEKRFVEETTRFLSQVAKGIAGASTVKMIPKRAGGTWTAHQSSNDFSCTIHYVPSDLYPRGPGPIQVEKDKVRSRGLAHILWAVEGSQHERNELRDASPLLSTTGFAPKIPAFHALWKTLVFREMVAGLTDWRGRDVQTFRQMADMAGAPLWMHELFQHRYHSGNEEYDRLLLSNLTFSEQFLDVLMYLRVHYQGGDLSLSDPRLINPRVHSALAESLGSMTEEEAGGWGRVLFDDDFFNQPGLHKAVAQRIWPAFDRLFEEDVERKMLQKALAKMLQDRQQELNERQREAFRQAIFENIDNKELQELLNFLEQLGAVEKDQLRNQARQEMNQKLERFSENMQRDLLGEESPESGGEPRAGQEGESSSGGSEGSGAPHGKPQLNKSSHGTETRGPGSSSPSTPDSLQEAIEKLSQNLSTLEKQLADLGQKAQGIGDEVREVGSSAGSSDLPAKGDSLREDGKTIQEGVHGLQQQGRDLAQGVELARQKAAQNAAGLPAPGAGKKASDALDFAGEQADKLLGKLQEIQQKANDLSALADRLAKSLGSGDATLPRDQADALQKMAKELEKSLNEVGRQGPAHAIEKALQKAQEAVKQLGETLKSMPGKSPPAGSGSEGGPDRGQASEGDHGTPTDTPGQPTSSSGARAGAVDLKPFELDGEPSSQSLWGDRPQTPSTRVQHPPQQSDFSGFSADDFVDIKTVFPGLTEHESEEYRQWRAPHEKLLEELVRVLPQLLHWTEGADIRGGKYQGILTDIAEALTLGAGRSTVEPSKPLALKFTVLVDRSGSMDDEEKQKTVQFLLLLLAEMAFALQKSVPRGPEYRDLFQFTVGFHDTEEEHLITHKTSGQLRMEGISKESVIYKLLKSAEAQGGTELAEHVKKYHDDLSGFQPKGTQGDSPARKILIVTSDMEVSQEQFDSLGKKLSNNTDEKNPRRKVLTILVPTGKNEFAKMLKDSVGNSGVVLDAKPYKNLYLNILTIFAAGLDPKVSVNPETIARVGLEKMRRSLLPRAMSGWFGVFYWPFLRRGWDKTASVMAALLESGPAVLVGNLLGLCWIYHSIYFIVIHLGKPLTEWARDADGARILKQGTTSLTLRQWPLVFLFGALGAFLHIWGVEFLLEVAGPHLGAILTSSEILPFTKTGIAVLLHALYNLFTPWSLGMAGASADLNPFGDYKNFFIRERGGLEYLVYKDDIEELEWQRAPNPTRAGVSVPQEPMENIPDNEQTLKELLKKNFISGAVYMLKSEDERRWFRPGSGADMEYWEQDEKGEWRLKGTFPRDKTPGLRRMDADGRAYFADPDASLAWSWVSEKPETLLIRENGGTDKPVVGWPAESPRTLELKKVSDDVIVAFSADELKPALFRLVRQDDGWRVEESFLLDFKDRRTRFVGLIGPTGVGKEKFLKAFGQLMNLPVDILSGHDKLMADELLYSTHIGRPEPGSTSETPSVIARALYHGGVGVLDEEKVVRAVPKDVLLPCIANGTIGIDREGKPVFQSPWGRFMTTANYDQENIGTATTGEKALAWQRRHMPMDIAPARPEQETMWQIGKAESRFRKGLSGSLQTSINELVKEATRLRLKVLGFSPAQSSTIVKREGGVSIQWRRCLLGEGGDRMVPALSASDRLSRAPSPRVIEHIVQHFAAFPMDFAYRKWSVIRRYFNFDADDAPPGEYSAQVQVSFERKGFVDDQPGECPPLTIESFKYLQRDGRHFLRLTPLTPAGDADPRWDPVELEIFDGSWLFSGAMDSGMKKWIELPENRLRLYKALQGWSLGMPLLFIGEPSSGKSRLAELLRGLVGGERYQVPVNKETMPHNLFYDTVLRHFVTTQKPRSILEAGLKGGSCLIDEAHLLSQTMQGAFNNALSSGHYNLDGALYRMPYLIFAMNEPDDNYSPLNAAFEERMDSQQFTRLSPAGVKAQTSIPEIGGDTFNDRLIGEEQTDANGQPVPQADGQPHFLGLLGVMDYIRHHPAEFPKPLYISEFQDLVADLAHNEAQGLETALRQVAQGQTPWRLPQRKLLEIIRDGCRWPEGRPEDRAEWDRALQKAMGDAGLWNDEAEQDPAKDGLLKFLNGEGLFIKDYPIVHTPDLGDSKPNPILDALLFLQRRTRGTRVQSELSTLWDHLNSLQSRWESLPFPDRMVEVHVLREIHTTAGEIVKARRGQHLPETITELERLQAGIRNFLFSPEVGWPGAALDPSLQRGPWLNRHSLPTPGQMTLDDLLGKVQVFPGDMVNSPRWVQKASDGLMDAARAGTAIPLNTQEKKGAINLPELAEVYLEPLAALEQSLRGATDAVPGLADTVAQLQMDIRAAIHERRSRTSLIDDLARRLKELKEKVMGRGDEPRNSGEWTREALIEEEARFLNASLWFTQWGNTVERDPGGNGPYVWKSLGAIFTNKIQNPLTTIQMAAVEVFGVNWRSKPRNDKTGELADAELAVLEAKIRWLQKQMIKVLIREGKVAVEGHPNFEWGTVSEPDINIQGTHAVMAHQGTDGKVDYLVVGLEDLGSAGVNAWVLPLGQTLSAKRPWATFAPIVFFNNFVTDLDLLNQPRNSISVCFGSIENGNTTIWKSFIDKNLKGPATGSKDDHFLWRFKKGEPKFELIGTWKTGAIYGLRYPEGHFSFFREEDEGGQDPWDLAKQETAAQRGDVPAWLGDVMREALEKDPAFARSVTLDTLRQEVIQFLQGKIVQSVCPPEEFKFLLKSDGNTLVAQMNLNETEIPSDRDPLELLRFAWFSLNVYDFYLGKKSISVTALRSLIRGEYRKVSSRILAMGLENDPPVTPKTTLEDLMNEAKDFIRTHGTYLDPSNMMGDVSVNVSSDGQYYELKRGMVTSLLVVDEIKSPSQLLNAVADILFGDTENWSAPNPDYPNREPENPFHAEWKAKIDRLVGKELLLLKRGEGVDLNQIPRVNFRLDGRLDFVIDLSGRQETVGFNLKTGETLSYEELSSEWNDIMALSHGQNIVLGRDEHKLVLKLNDDIEIPHKVPATPSGAVPSRRFLGSWQGDDDNEWKIVMLVTEGGVSRLILLTLHDAHDPNRHITSEDWTIEKHLAAVSRDEAPVWPVPYIRDALGRPIGGIRAHTVSPAAIPAHWISDVLSLGHDIAGALDRAVGALKEKAHSLMNPTELTNVQENVPVQEKLRTRESLLEEERRFLNESKWFKEKGFEFRRNDAGSKTTFDLYSSGVCWFWSVEAPRICILETAEITFGKNWETGERNPKTGELIDPEQAKAEAKICWLQKEMIKILIREGKVDVEGKANYVWGDVSEVDINAKGTHAVVLNKNPSGGPSEIVVLALDTLILNKINGRVLLDEDVGDALSGDPGESVGAVFFDKKNVTNLSPGKIGYFMESNSTKLRYFRSFGVEPDMRPTQPFWVEIFVWPSWKIDWGSPIAFHSWPTGGLVVSHTSQGTKFYSLQNSQPNSFTQINSWVEWTMENHEQAVARGEEPAWLSDVMREALKNGSAANGSPTLDALRQEVIHFLVGKELVSSNSSHRMKFILENDGKSLVAKMIGPNGFRKEISANSDPLEMLRFAHAAAEYFSTHLQGGALTVRFWNELRDEYRDISSRMIAMGWEEDPPVTPTTTLDDLMNEAKDFIRTHGTYLELSNAKGDVSIEISSDGQNFELKRGIVIDRLVVAEMKSPAQLLKAVADILFGDTENWYSPDPYRPDKELENPFHAEWRAKIERIVGKELLLLKRDEGADLNQIPVVKHRLSIFLVLSVQLSGKLELVGFNLVQGKTSSPEIFPSTWEDIMEISRGQTIKIVRGTSHLVLKLKRADEIPHDVPDYPSGTVPSRRFLGSWQGGNDNEWKIVMVETAQGVPHLLLLTLQDANSPARRITFEEWSLEKHLAAVARDEAPVGVTSYIRDALGRPSGRILVPEIEKVDVKNVLLEMLLPQWKNVVEAVQQVSGGEPVSHTEAGGTGALNTSPAQAPPSADAVRILLPILEAGLQPLVDIKNIHDLLPSSPSTDEAPPLLKILLDAVSAVTKPIDSTPSTPPTLKTPEELWDDVADFFQSLETLKTPATQGQSVLEFAGVQDLELKKSPDGTSYTLSFWEKLGSTNNYAERRFPPFITAEKNPLAPLVALGRALGGDDFADRSQAGMRNRPIDPLIDALLREIDRMKSPILLSIFPNGMGQDTYGTVGMEELGQVPNPIERAIPLGLQDLLKKVVDAVNNGSRVQAQNPSTPPAQTTASRQGWITFLNSAETRMGRPLPIWARGPVGEAVYTAVREMRVYWGIFLVLGGIVGLFVPSLWGAVFLAAVGVFINYPRFLLDHPKQGRDLGLWFPLGWNLFYALAVFTFSLGDLFLGGIGLAAMNMVLHAAYDSPRLAARQKLLNHSLENLNSLPSAPFTLPRVKEEVKEINERLTPQQISFSQNDVSHGVSVLKTLFSSNSVEIPKGTQVVPGLRLIGERLEEGKGAPEVFERYEGSLAVLAAQGDEASERSEKLSWGKALAPVLALRKALGLEEAPRRAILSLLFRSFVQTALETPILYPADRPLHPDVPILADISLLLDPQANETLKKKLTARLKNLAQQKKGHLIVTADRGTSEDYQKVFDQLHLSVSLRVLFFPASSVAEHGVIDGVRLTDELLRYRGDLYVEAKTPDDIKFDLVTDNIDRIVGLSPHQIVDLVLVTLKGLIHITRQEIENALKIEEKKLSFA